MTRPPLFVGIALLAGLAAVGGCARAPRQQLSKSDAGALADCRARTEAAYNRQNRYLLSERDTTDSPFSTSGNTGITTQGLSDRYALDVALNNCVHATSPGERQNTGEGATFVGPAADRPPGNPTQ